MKHESYAVAVGRHGKASPARTGTIRKTERLTAALPAGATIRADKLAEAAARHVHPRRKRGAPV